MIYWQLFLAFFIPNIVGYGGGPAIIPLIENEVVGTYGWMTHQQFAETLALGNALPSPIATKMAGYIGYAIAGVGGGRCAGHRWPFATADDCGAGHTVPLPQLDQGQVDEPVGQARGDGADGWADLEFPAGRRRYLWLVAHPDHWRSGSAAAAEDPCPSCTGGVPWPRLWRAIAGLSPAFRFIHP